MATPNGANGGTLVVRHGETVFFGSRREYPACVPSEGLRQLFARDTQRQAPCAVLDNPLLNVRPKLSQKLRLGVGNSGLKSIH